MVLSRVESVLYGVEDLDAAMRYFDDFGLEQVERGAGGAVFRTLANQTVQLRRADDPTLPPALESGSTLRETIWGVDGKDALDAIGAELSRDREVWRDVGGLLHAKDDSGLPIGFAVAQPVAVEPKAHPWNVGDLSPRVNRPFERDERVRPLRLVHVVFHIKEAGHEQAASFYLDRLKFRLSDRSVNAGDFMRCEGSGDHHNLLLLHRADQLGYNHVAFEVRGIDDIILGGQYMKKRGWKATRRPGRHFLGSNLHWFFESPCGGRTEFIADMDRLTPDWQPRIWEKHPGDSIWLFDPE